MVTDKTIWQELKINKPSEAHIGDWIRQNTDRNNFYFDATNGLLVLSLFEVLLQYRLQPRYERKFLLN